MKFTVNEILEMKEASTHYDAQEKRNFKLTLLMVQNAKVINGFIQDFEDAKKKLMEKEEITKYNQERQKLIDSHRIRKEDGSYETSTMNGQMVFKLERLEELQHKLNAFDTANQTTLDLIQANEKEIQKLTEEEHELKLKHITETKLVEEMSTKTLVACAPIVKVSLTEETLGGKAEELTTKQIERLMKYCEVR